MKFEVLCVTTNRKNYQFLEDLNIKSNVIIANQSHKYEKEIISNGSQRVEFITTDTKGVGKNRNIALLNTTADICLLADDDIKYNSNLEEVVINAFNEVPEADVIIFNMDDLSNREKRRINKSIKPVRKWNALNYGAVRIAFRKESIAKANIWFSTLFGGGTIYGAGEDSIFIWDCLKKNLKIYTYPATIGTILPSESTWFTGFNYKYFFDKGALFKVLFPRLNRIMNVVYLLKHRHITTGIGFKASFKAMIEGSDNYKKFGE